MKSTMRTLGFSDGEIDLYLRLLELGEATIAECLKRLDISRPHAYTLMKTLMNKGLVAEVSGKPAKFRVLPPEESFMNLSTRRLKEIDNEKAHIEEGMAAIREKANLLFKQVQFPAEAEIEFMVFKGYRHVVEWMTKFYGMTKNNLRVMTCPPSAVDMMRGKPGAIEKFTEKKSFPAKILASEDMLHDAKFKEYMASQIVGGVFDLRVAPSVPLKMSIFDSFAGIITLNVELAPEDFLVVIVRNQELLGFFVQAYDCAWDKARPISLEELKQ